MNNQQIQSLKEIIAADLVRLAQEVQRAIAVPGIDPSAYRRQFEEIFDRFEHAMAQSEDDKSIKTAGAHSVYR